MSELAAAQAMNSAWKLPQDNMFVHQRDTGWHFVHIKVKKINHQRRTHTKTTLMAIWCLRTAKMRR